VLIDFAYTGDIYIVIDALMINFFTSYCLEIFLIFFSYNVYEKIYPYII